MTGAPRSAGTIAVHLARIAAASSRIERLPVLHVHLARLEEVGRLSVVGDARAHFGQKVVVERAAAARLGGRTCGRLESVKVGRPQLVCDDVRRFNTGKVTTM